MPIAMMMDLSDVARVLPVYVTRFVGRESELETLRPLAVRGCLTGAMRPHRRWKGSAC